MIRKISKVQTASKSNDAKEKVTTTTTTATPSEIKKEKANGDKKESKKEVGGGGEGDVIKADAAEPVKTDEVKKVETEKIEKKPIQITKPAPITTPAIEAADQKEAVKAQDEKALQELAEKKRLKDISVADRKKNFESVLEECKKTRKTEYKKRRDIDEKSSCSFNKLDDKTVAVESEWKGRLTGGYQSVKNPQFSLVLENDAEVTITLIRVDDEAGEQGLCLFLMRNPIGGRVMQFQNGNVCTKSKFVIGRKTEIKTFLQANDDEKPYIIIPNLERKSAEGRFRLTVQVYDSPYQLHYVPLNKILHADSGWSGPLTGGYQSTKNPQFELSLTRPCSVQVTLQRPKSKNNDDGMCFFVCKGVLGKSQRPKKHLPDKHIIYKSNFIVADEICETFELTPEPNVPFIIIASRRKTGKEGTCTFRLSLESEDHNSKLIEVRESPPRYKEQSFAELIEPLKVPGKTGLLKENPVDRIIELCRATNTIFLDPDFPHDKALNDRPNDEFIIEPEDVDEWRRLDHLCDNPELFSDGIEPDDMQQGELGDCWFCQAVAAVAQQSPGKLYNLFYPKELNQFGVYSVKIYLDHQWYYVLVDDYIPCKAGKPVFAHSSDPDETWVCILEKALAKVQGSYQAMVGRTGRTLGAAKALSCLTGGDSKTVVLKTGDMSETLWTDILNYTKNKWFIGSGSHGKATQGIVSTHGYSILNAVYAEGLKLMKVRNTWGNTEWTGDWSDKSSLWNDQIKKQVEYSDSDDGIFWMNFFDFTMQFNHLYLCRLIEDIYGYTTSADGEWKKRMAGGVMSHNNPQFNLTFLKREARNVNIMIKLIRENKKDSLGIITYVYKNGGHRAYNLYEKSDELVIKSAFVDSKEVVIEGQLPDGGSQEYVITVCLEHKGSEGAFKVLLYADCPHKLALLEPWASVSEVGQWKGASAAGYKNIKNPKFTLEVQETTKCWLELKRPPRENPDGMSLIVCKGPLPEDQVQIPDENIIEKTGFLRAHEVAMEIILEAGKYLLIPCHKKIGLEGEGEFTILVENEHGQVLLTAPPKQSSF